MVTKAVIAVNAATAKVNQLKEELHQRADKVEQLCQDLAKAAIDVQSTRERADKLEERFAQVYTQTAPGQRRSYRSAYYLLI